MPETPPDAPVPARGEVWWINLDPTIGSEIRKTRPCVIVTADPLNERRRTVVVVPLSTAQNASPPLLVPVVCNARQSVAVIDQVRAVAKQRLVKVIGRLTARDLAAIEDGLRQVLELG